MSAAPGNTSVDTAALWRDFCARLQAAGDHVLGSDLATTDLERREGLRYLTRLTRIGLEMHLENADPAFPSFYQASDATAKIGADNPDNYYQNATISAAQTYRIWGTRGTVPILSFATKANRYAIDGSMASTGEIDIRDVDVADDGSFEIIASVKRPAGDWLPLEADSSILIVRQTFFDRAAEIPATVNIEALDNGASPAPLSEDRLVTALQNVPAFVSGTSAIFRNWAETFRAEHKNTLTTADQSMFVKAGGDPMIYYLHGWWDLAPGEALEITTAIPKCEGWNFQINNVWMESLDYRHHTIHTNNGLAVLNDDGTVTVTVSASGMGKNPINTAGHSKGTMLWRWTGAEDHPVPTTKIIKEV